MKQRFSVAPLVEHQSFSTGAHSFWNAVGACVGLLVLVRLVLVVQQTVQVVVTEQEVSLSVVPVAVVAVVEPVFAAELWAQ